MPSLESARKKFASVGEQTLETVLELAPLAIATLDLAGKVTRWNAVAQQLLGWSADDMMQSSNPGAANEADWLRQLCGTALREGLTTVACRRPRADGSAVDVSVSVSVTRNTGGRAQGFVAVYVEPTVRTYIRHDDALEILGQLACGIALEINTPSQYVGDNLRFMSDAWVRIVQMFIGLNRMRAALNAGDDVARLRVEADSLCRILDSDDVEFLIDEVPKAIAQSIDGVQRVGRMVNAMRAFSPPTGNTRKPIDLNAAIEATMLVATTELKYVADTETDFDPNLPEVWCVPGEINRVIYALFSNAAKAIADAALVRPGIGHIHVSTHALSEAVELRISDDGTGIPVAIQPHVFDPLYSNNRSAKDLDHSLAVAHVTIVKHHRGRIWFETTPGVGTTFIVQLPVRRRAAGETR